MITGKFYDVLKLIALILLPALGSAYFILDDVLGLPAVRTTLGCILLVDFALGALLYFSSRIYALSESRFDGQMDVQKLEGKTVFQMSFDDEMAITTLEDKKEVRFKVNAVD